MSKVIKKSITIEQIELSSSDWQLYHGYKQVGEEVVPARPWEDEDTVRPIFDVDHNDPKSIQSAACAITMNRTFTDSVNAGHSARVVYDRVQSVAREFKSGGTDTEPRNVLLDLIEEVFGREAAEGCW